VSGCGIRREGVSCPGDPVQGLVRRDSEVGCWLVRWKAGQDSDPRLSVRAGLHITLTRDNHPTQEPRRKQALTGARLIISHR